MTGTRGRTYLRWIVRAVLGIVALALLLLVLPFLSIRIPSVRGWLLDRSLHGKVLSPDWSLRIDSVDRFNPWGLRMLGLHLIRTTAEGDREYASLGRLEFRWDLRGLLRRRIWARQIGMDSLVIRTDVPPPTFASPKTERAEGEDRPIRLPWLRLDSFQLDFRIVSGLDRLASGSIALHGLEHRGGGLQGTVGEVLLTYHPDSLTVHWEGGTIEGSLASAIHLRGARLSSDEGSLSSRLDGDLFLSPGGERPWAVAVVCDLDRFRPGQASLIRRLGVPFAQRDSLQGELRLEHDPAFTSARFEGGGRLLDGSLESFSLNASLRGDSIEVHDLGLIHRCGSIQGDGLFLLPDKRLTGRAELRSVNLADSALVIWLPGMPRTDIGGTIRGEAVFNDGRTEADLSGDVQAAELFGWSTGPISFQAGLHGSRLTVDNLRVGELGSGLAARGWWATETGLCEATVDLDGVRLEEWLEPLLRIGMAGAVHGTALVSGEISSPMIRGNLWAEQFRVVEIGAAQVQVDSISGSLIPPRFNGVARAKEIDLYGVGVDSAAFVLRWGEKMGVDVEAHADTISATASVEITPAEPGSLLVRHLDVTPGRHAAWRSTREGRVDWHAGSVKIDDVQLESSDGSVSGWLTLDGDPPQLGGRVQVDGFDLSAIERFFGLADSTLAGRIDLDAALGGTTDTPSTRLAIGGRGVIAAGWPVGEFDGTLSLSEEGTVRIDSLRAGTMPGAGTVVIRDLIARTGLPLPALLQAAGDSLPLLLERTELESRVNLSGLSLSRVVRTALEATPGVHRGLFTESADPMMSRIRTVHVGRMRENVGVTDEVAGTVFCDLDLAGSAASPRASARGGVRDFHLYQARADSILFALDYVPGSLTLDSLVWHRDDRASRARGRLPVLVDPLKGRAELLRGDSISLDAQLPEIDLAILGVLSRQITDPEGFLSGDVALRGTPEHVWPEGSLSIREGGIRIPNREERIYAIEGSLSLDSTGVVINSLVGRIGEEGRLAARGTVRNPKDFYLEGEVRGATAYETGLYSVTFNGDFRAFPIESREGITPLLIGSVDVLEAAIIGDLAKAPVPVAIPGKASSPWQAEIDVYAPGNMRIQTSVASIDLGEAENLHVSFDDPEFNVSGGIRVLGGRYRLFNSIFTITSGEIVFRDTGAGVVEPILDVQADTHVNVYTAGVSDLKTEKVSIHVTGPLSDMKTELSSESGLAADEIVALLSIGWLYGKEGQIGVADPSKQYLFTEIVSQLESEISKLVTPLQNVSVMPGEEPGAAWRLNVRQTILPQVSVVYTRDLASIAEQGVSIHYNLHGQLYLNAAVERRQEEGAPADRYLLDLKMRFEYK